MAKKVPEGKRFKRGESGNPDGRPPLPPEIKQARALTTLELQRALNELIHCSREELKAKVSAPNATLLTLTIGSILSQAVQKGDPIRLNFLIERLVGKVKDVVEVKGGFAQMSDQELLEWAPKAIDALAKKANDS